MQNVKRYIVMNYRRILGLLIALLCTVALSAQVTDQGNFLIGSTLGFSTSDSQIDQSVDGVNESSSGKNATQLNVAPALGYFVIDNIALGVGMDYTLNRVSEAGQEEDYDSDLLFGPFARFYMPLSGDMALFLETTFGFGNSVDQIDIDGETRNTSTNVFAAGVGPGFTIYSDSAIGIEAAFKYNFARSESDTQANELTIETITTTNQIDFSIGVQFYFTRLRPVNTSGGGSSFY